MAALRMETVSTTLSLIDCASCSIQFAVPEPWEAHRREDGDTFWCPNGHTLSFKGEIDKLRRRLAAEQARATSLADQLQAAERSAAAQRGQVTKLKNRIAKGVCPECHRSFANLHRHMDSKHPGYGAS